MNIYHCCAHKTASQWVKSILSDPQTLEGTGLGVDNYYYEEVMLPKIEQQQDHFDVPPPPNVVVSPIYATYDVFQNIPKDDDYRVFTVIRDPRDIIISWYFSIKLTHEPVRIKEVRAANSHLKEMPLHEGLLASISYCKDILKILSSWKEAEKFDPNVKLFRFEDLTQGDNLATFQELFDHCKIPISESSLRAVLERYSFKTLTNRSTGEADFSSHLRKGVAGDWANYFTQEIQAEFARVAGDLPTQLGYESTEKYLLNYQYRLIEQKVTGKQQELSQIEDDFGSYAQAQRDVQQFKGRVQQLEGDIQQLRATLQQTEAQRQSGQQALQQTQAALQQSQTELTNATATAAKLQQGNERLAAKLQETDQAMHRVKAERNQLKQQRRELKQALTTQQGLARDRQAQIEAMESSKFWKLRSQWMRVKRRLQLTQPGE